MDSSPRYTATILSHIRDVSAADWDGLIPSGNHPFLSHRFLLALEESGSAIPETGWAPRHIWVEDEDGQVIGCLLYTSPSPRDGLLSRMPSSA